MLARNEGAEKHICKMLKLAKHLDTSRLRISGCIEPATQSSLAAEPKSVDVVDANGTLKYQLQSPHQRYAACNCQMAQQRMICHHQVACLLASSLDTAAAERAIYRLLGHRFGFLGGCSDHGIDLLWQELLSQPPPGRHTGTCIAASCAAALASGVMAANAQGGADNCNALDSAWHHAARSGHVESAAEPTVAPAAASIAAPAATPIMGQQAFDSGWQSLATRATAMFEGGGAPNAIPPQCRALIFSTVATAIAQCEEVVASATAGLQHTGAEFAGARFTGSLKRIPGLLERRKRNRRLAVAAKGAADVAEVEPGSEAAKPPQADFAHRSQLPGAAEKLQVSKAFANGRSAKQAAAHVQACLHEQDAHKAAAAVKGSSVPCDPPQKKVCQATGTTATEVPIAPMRSQPLRRAAPERGQYATLLDNEHQSDEDSM